MAKEKSSFYELRRRAKELGISGLMTMNTDTLRQAIATAEAREKEMTTPSTSSDFSDLGEIVEAPDVSEDVGKVEEPTPVLVEEPLPPPVDERPVIRLSADEFVMAVKTGQSSGLPLQAAQEAKVDGDEIAIGEKRHEVTGVIAGHQVKCSLATRTSIVDWTVIGSADDQAGKLRLMNDVRMMVDGNLNSFKAGKEFFPHQVDVEALKRAGGVIIPIGTPKKG